MVSGQYSDENDLLLAREKIRGRQEDGKSLKDKIKESKRITAGSLFKTGSFQIGKTIFDIQKENVTKKKEYDEKSTNKANSDIAKAIADVIAVRALDLD